VKSFRKIGGKTPKLWVRSTRHRGTLRAEGRSRKSFTTYKGGKEEKKSALTARLGRTNTEKEGLDPKRNATTSTRRGLHQRRSSKFGEGRKKTRRLREKRGKRRSDTPDERDLCIRTISNKASKTPSRVGGKKKKKRKPRKTKDTRGEPPDVGGLARLESCCTGKQEKKIRGVLKRQDNRITQDREKGR